MGHLYLLLSKYKGFLSEKYRKEKIMYNLLRVIFIIRIIISLTWIVFSIVTWESFSSMLGALSFTSVSEIVIVAGSEGSRWFQIIK